MADILPFQALRYNPSKVSPGDVMTQPYDKISPAMQDRYYAASPYNLVRMILGKPQAGDNEQRERLYPRRRVAAAMAGREGVLVRDPEPSIYVYSQRFKFPATRRERRLSGADSSRWDEWRITTARSSSGTSRH